MPASLQSLFQERHERIRVAAIEGSLEGPARGDREDADMDDRNQRIREIAYYLWEQEGGPESQADRHWAAAVAIAEQQDVERENSKSENMTEDPGGIASNEPLLSAPLEKSPPPSPPSHEGRRSAASR